jgi:RNA polymerase sigma-70 factor (ECF subfamily)
MVLLADQDRRRWRQPEIDRGLALVRQAARAGSVGQYWLQAAIVAEHVRARSAEDTDWEHVCRLYDSLLDLTRSPVVALNRAIAVSMVEGPEAGLQLLEGVTGELDGYVYFHSARADLHRRAGEQLRAQAAYRRALELATNDVQRAALDARLEELSAS